MLIVAGAAVLGIVVGACAGFLVQAEREPTRLPSLSQPSLAPAKGDAPEPLSAAQDRKVRTDGDLRELLLKKPRGARTGDWSGDDGWLDMAAYADTFEKPAGAFSDLVEEEFRRAAVATWRVGSTQSVEIRLVQYHQEEFLAASSAAENGYYWAEKEPGTRSWAVPGTSDGMAYVHTRPDTKPGYLPLYSAEAHAWRGDIAVQVWIFDTKPIPKSKIMDLAERQMERL
ncbi:hypothetical protein ACFS5L_43255 [Streptomyces phyllanthi]|uniref:Uncharacterized protein n=1 Tax=Streptomyces phyllanthi TaxID=1803180 RepID=A0A5N8WEV9_9ACTN|nr:hypothetical protein [Streptomyces phyllanthi]MPY46023.1 hypothetical protein [Streptomyces phyllanthi]